MPPATPSRPPAFRCWSAVPGGRPRTPLAGENDVHGTPQQILSQLRAYADAGTDEFIVRDEAGLPARQALEQIGILTQAILPGLTR